MMEQYHDLLLLKTLGTDYWDTANRHYKTISSATLPNQPDRPCVPILIEAFLVALYENCWEKWIALASHKRQNPGSKIPLPRKDAGYSVPYISSDSGRQTWGGWNPEGRKRVLTVAKLIYEARKAKHVKKMEEDVLARVRKANDVEERDQKRKDKKRKSVGEAKEVEDDMFDDFEG